MNLKYEYQANRFDFEGKKAYFLEKSGKKLTEKLYYDDPEQFSFQAEVVETVSRDGKTGVILNRTCFYPEGGGQPADRGLLDDIKVLDVQLAGENVIHFVERPLSAAVVTGQVDTARRWDFMQQHTGQHILSQSLLRAGKYNTLSVHFGEDYTAIETDAVVVSDDILQDTEKIANQVVCSNLPVSIHWVDRQEVEKYHIRRPPPDIKLIRIVKVGNYDASACGGLHVSSTGKVGLIKIIGWEKIRGRLRILAKIGGRAYQDYHQKTVLIQQLSQLLTCGTEGMLMRVTDLSEQLKDARRDLLRVQSDVAVSLAEKLVRDAPVLQGITFISHVFDNVDTRILGVFLEAVLQESHRVGLAVSRDEKQLHWMIGHSIPGNFSLSSLISPLLSIIDGRGGGKGSLWQGGGRNAVGLEEFIKQIKSKLDRELLKHE